MTGIDDILNEYHMLAFDRFPQIHQDAHSSRGSGLPIAGKRHEVNRVGDAVGEYLLGAGKVPLGPERLRQREELCSTALVPGVAMPHPRHPLPWDIAASFVVVGAAPRGIPYGAADGSLTRLFFLICCKDESTHLHVLARLGLILHGGTVIDDLISAEDPEQLSQMLLQREQAVACGKG